MKVPGIYRIVLTDGRCYVGQSGNMHRRWNEHRSRLRRGTHWLPHFQNCWNKYGEDAFRFEVIEQCDRDDLTEREQYWLDTLKPAFNVSPNAGNNGGYKRPFRNLTAEHKAKIAAAHRERNERLRAAGLVSPTRQPPKSKRARRGSPEYRAKMRAAAAKRGPITPETRAKMSAASRGKTLTPEHRSKIAAALTGKPGYYAGKTLSPEHRARIAAAKLGKKPSAAARASMSAGQRRRRERERAAKAAQQVFDLAV